MNATKFLLSGSISAAVMLAAVPALANGTEEVVAERIERDVRILADDSMEGREAGTRGYDMAAGYVAGQFAAIGLKPSANGTYFQHVPLVEYGRDPAVEDKLSFTGQPAMADLAAGKDYVNMVGLYEGGVVEAPLVFVGHAFTDPAHDWDDFASVDLNGKIAVMVRSAPKVLDSEQGAHHRSERSRLLSEAGAVGILWLSTPEFEKAFPWPEASAFLGGEKRRVQWADAQGKAHSTAPNILVSGMLGPDAAKALFEGEPLSWDELVAGEAEGLKPLPTFEMKTSARFEVGGMLRPTGSNNVIGIIPGTDPELRNEVVVVTAHLDGKGVMPTAEEGDDEINNGAMDNATGTASILEIARTLVDRPLKRTVMFVALTAEEQGLVGSDYLARHPVLEEGQRFVANVNLDMPIVNYEFADVIAFGAERSTLYPIVEAAAERAGVPIVPDPAPEQGFFVRSDQYRFVQQGIPAVYLDLGFGNGGEEAQRAFLSQHYHRPSDEVEHVRFDQLARLTAVNLEIVEAIANMDEAPRWKKGDFFGTTFNGPMEE